MLPINPYSLEAINSLEKMASVHYDRHQKMQSKPVWLRKVLSYFSPQEQVFLSLGKTCNTLFDRLEQIPTIFSEVKSKTNDQQESFSACFRTAEKVKALLSSSKSEEVKAQFERLTQRVAALQYRIEAANGGLDCSKVDLNLVTELSLIATQWKRDNALMINKQFTPAEIKKLEEASTYPQFIHALLKSKSLQDAFFNWALRDNNGVKQFVEFPALCERLKSVYLAARIGRFGGAMLSLEKRAMGENAFEKIVSLPFFIRNQVEYVNILDDSQEVVLKNNWRLTIGEVMEIFSQKNNTVGNLEFFQSTGITNWNSHKLGFWNPETQSYDRIDLTLERWWEQLPVLEEVSKETFEKRLNLSLAENEWVVCAKSSRSTADMDLDKRHGYLEPAVPTERGTYKIYDFGNFAAIFPTSALDLMLFVTNTLEGKIAYPDENFFYSHRQQAAHPIKLTVEQGLTLMNALQKELIKARFGHVIFQFAGENCAYWAQNVLNAVDHEMPDFYKSDLISSTPLNPILGRLFRFFRRLPIYFRSYAIFLVDTILGSGRGVQVLEYGKEVFKSYKNSPVREKRVLYQPANLHQQILDGKFHGVVTYGNN